MMGSVVKGDIAPHLIVVRGVNDDILHREAKLRCILG